MVSRKAKERRRISRAAKATRPAAYADARALCAAVGPEAIAAEYDVDAGASPKQIATAYAEAAYRKEVRKQARGMEPWRALRTSRRSRSDDGRGGR